MKTILYDVPLRRPACVLLQAVAGTTVTSDDLSRFKAEWLVHPTDAMKVYTVTEEQLEVLQRMEGKREDTRTS